LLRVVKDSQSSDRRGFGSFERPRIVLKRAPARSEVDLLPMDLLMIGLSARGNETGTFGDLNKSNKNWQKAGSAE
jgi:hypothetical protein